LSGREGNKLAVDEGGRRKTNKGEKEEKNCKRDGRKKEEKRRITFTGKGGGREKNCGKKKGSRFNPGKRGRKEVERPAKKKRGGMHRFRRKGKNLFEGKKKGKT